MALAQYEPVRQNVRMSRNGSFSVRGLNLADLSTLVTLHMVELEAAFRMWSTSGVGAGGDLTTGILALVRDFPPLAANIIAMASDEPLEGEKARFLPFPVQVEAITAVGRLTFEDVGGLEPFMETLASLVGGLGGSPLALLSVEKMKAA